MYPQIALRVTYFSVGQSDSTGKVFSDAPGDSRNGLAEEGSLRTTSEGDMLLYIENSKKSTHTHTKKTIKTNKQVRCG